MSCAVAFRRPGRVVLASDSLWSVNTDDGEASTYTAPKLQNVGPWWFVAVGGLDYPGTDVDVTTTVAYALSEAGTMRECFAAIATHAAAFGRLLKHLHASGQPAPMLRIFIGGVDAGLPTLGYWSIYATETWPNFRVEWGYATAPGNLADADGSVSGSCSFGGPAIRLFEQPRPEWLQVGDVAAAWRVLELQIAETPHVVNYPIDVVEITSEGARFERFEAIKEVAS